MTFKRARQAEQKADRRASILAKARELCAEYGIQNWSLNELGRRAEVNKSNLYRYFGSREEILMTLMTEETGAFVEAFTAATEGKTLNAEEFAKLIAEQYCAQSFLCELLSLSSTLLEHNVKLEKVRDIKLGSASQMGEIAKAIAHCLPGVDESEAGQIAFTSGVIAAGLWPMANPAAPMRKLTQFEGLEHLHFDFESQMEQMMANYIKGVMAK
ncbi:TetR family transcriptional regulator [Ferrimonas sp. YFM]|nr:TetR family transcriptional regulator [Ferrimonas sp. YFM]